MKILPIKSRENKNSTTIKKDYFILQLILILIIILKLLFFVEGKTEEITLPMFLKFYGTSCDNLGIEIINIGGVSNFYGKNIRIKDENTRKYMDNIVTSYKHLINYNLNKWQALPYFLGDAENKLAERVLVGEFII